jgi:dTDP-4-amino-4,6-dideoxygalactose transaminase
LPIPFLDLKEQYLTIKHEIQAVLTQVLEETSFVLGKAVEDFEEKFAQFCGCQYGVGVNSGTSALQLALWGNDIGIGDEVITVPNTFIATVEAISLVGATPVLVDIDPKNLNIDITRIEEKITPKTRAIIPVHLYGRPADLDPIIDIAQKYQLKVIEDACQAHGALYKGKRVGSLGQAGCFSFYPSKNLGAFGEAGMVVTNDSTLALRLKRLRDHGQRSKNIHEEKGINARMEAIQGAVLGVKLKYLLAWNQKRRQLARLYNKLLQGVGDLVLPEENNTDSQGVYHLYVIQTAYRDKLYDYLTTAGIGVGIHYPIPIHLQMAYKELGYKVGDFPVAERVAQQILSLPIYPELQREQIIEVTQKIKEFFALNDK